MNSFVASALEADPRFVLLLLGELACAFSPPAQAAETGRFEVERMPAAVKVSAPGGREVLRYQLERPSESGLSVASGCYFHPVATPNGVVLTDVAPSDHLHHRGVFLAWVEMHGAVSGDFWGWGEHAPKERRVISNREVSRTRANHKGASFLVRNEWMAEDRRVLSEKLQIAVRNAPPANVMDLVYTFTPAMDLTLARWAFSGFCVRLRKDGLLEAQAPSGVVTLPNPKHTEPLSDWPAAAWYDYTLRFDDGTLAGVAVIDHPRNPPTLWHNHRETRMLNPCIIAPGQLQLRAGKALVLRYRVVAHDGPVDRALLDRLAAEWADR